MADNRCGRQMTLDCSLPYVAMANIPYHRRGWPNVFCVCFLLMIAAAGTTTGSEQPLMLPWSTHAHEKKIKAATDFTDCCLSGMESSMKSV